VVRTADPGPVRDALQHASGVRSALLVGDRVHLFVDDVARRLPELRRQLDDRQVPYDAVEPVAPSVEDVFVSAVEGAAS
jgi:ABC-2 type transport system ATP-binding protein